MQLKRSGRSDLRKDAKSVSEVSASSHCRYNGKAANKSEGLAIIVGILD